MMYLQSKIKKMKIRQNALMKRLQESDKAKKTLKEDVGTLRKRVECPVCLEIPRSGPVFVCKNGHFVCQKCKRGGSCPTCREVMGTNKSILAVTVIEIVLHDCKFDECKEQFPLKDIEEHEKVCKHRIVKCPHFDFCGGKASISKLLEHMREAECCRNDAPESVVNKSGSASFSLTDLSELSDADTHWSVITYSYMGAIFALCAYKSDYCWHFNIVMFESPEVCSSFNVEIEVYEKNSSPDSRLSAKLRCKPSSIDEPRDEIEELGLSINDKLMRKLVLRENSFNFTVSFSFF